jgi:hypothetical protein
MVISAIVWVSYALWKSHGVLPDLTAPAIWAARRISESENGLQERLAILPRRNEKGGQCPASMMPDQSVKSFSKSEVPAQLIGRDY